jgi:hypothetical protein
MHAHPGGVASCWEATGDFSPRRRRQKPSWLSIMTKGRFDLERTETIATGLAGLATGLAGLATKATCKMVPGQT